jgi:hypothetical protein
MNAIHRLGSAIFVNGVERRSDCEVQIIFKEDQLVDGKPKARYLRQLLEPLGVKIEVGEWIGRTAFLPLSVSRQGAPLTKADVIQVLARDNQIELSPQVAG